MAISFISLAHFRVQLRITRLQNHQIINYPCICFILTRQKCLCYKLSAVFAKTRKSTSLTSMWMVFFRLSGNTSQAQEYQQKLQPSLVHHGDQVLQNNMGHFKKWVHFCSELSQCCHEGLERVPSTYTCMCGADKY